MVKMSLNSSAIIVIAVMMVQFVILKVDMKNIPRHRYVSPAGKDVPDCGTETLPCWSLGYMKNTSKLFWPNTVNVMYIEGRYMACENIRVVEGLKIIGINGRPLFKCDHSCNQTGSQSFLNVFLSENVTDFNQSTVIIENLEFTNKGCNPLIRISRITSFLFNNILVRDSPAPAIIIRRFHTSISYSEIPLNIIVRNSTFLSAYGIRVAVGWYVDRYSSSTSISIYIHSCKFIGDRAINGRPIKGITIKTRVVNLNIELFINSTIFMYLAPAISIGISIPLNFPYFNVKIQNSTFLHNVVNGAFGTVDGAAISIASTLPPNKATRIIFMNVLFQNNTSLVGGAFSLLTSRNSNFKVIFRDCKFIANRATIGGAISLRNSSTPSTSGLEAHGQTAVHFYSCLFENNRATYDRVSKDWQEVTHAQGGALSCYNSKIYISESNFRNNYADSFGGSIYDDRCLIYIANTTIRNDNTMYNLPTTGEAIYTGGREGVNNLTIETEIATSSSIWFTGSGTLFNTYVVPRMLQLTCFKGNNILLKTRLTTTGYFHLKGNTILYSCVPCPKNFYSLDNGFGKIINATTIITHNIQCLPCPYGGICSSSIKAKPNFWGYKLERLNPQTVQFFPCPREYCCQGNNCKTYNSCNENREGTLCGKCRDGFVEGLSSAKCFDKIKCGNPLIWLMIILGGTGYVLFFMYLPEITNFLMYLIDITYFLKLTDCCRKNGDASDSSPASSYTFAGLIKVIFFFSQIETLIKIDQTNINMSHLIHAMSSSRSVFRHVLNFQVSMLCPFKTLDAITKICVFGAFPIVLLLILAILTISFWLYKFIRKSVLKFNKNASNERVVVVTGKKKSSNESRVLFTDRSIPCLVNLVLLTYGTIAKSTMALLNCPKINDVSVLYIDGTVTCYNLWQYLVIAFVCVFVFPLPFGLTLYIRKLKNGKLTVTQFLLRLCFPIFGIFDIIRFLRIKSILTPKRCVNGNSNGSMTSQLELQDQLLESHCCVQKSETHSPAPHTTINNTLQCPQEEDRELEEELFIPQDQTHDEDQSQVQFENAESSESCPRATRLRIPLLSKYAGTSEYAGTNASIQEDDHNSVEAQSRTDSENAILNVIDSPFHTTASNYQINWESVLIFRRLIFILIFTFIPYPTLRIVIMLILCLAMLLHTCYASPYKSNVANGCEIGVLVILTILCVINSLVAFSHESNAHLTGYLTLLPHIFAWIEVTLIDIIPFIVSFALIIMIARRLLLLLCKLVFSLCHRNYEDHQD